MSTIDGARHADQTDATDAAMPRSSLAIEATGLTKSFGDTRAVDGVDLAVRSGSVIIVLGVALGYRPAQVPSACSPRWRW